MDNPVHLINCDWLQFYCNHHGLMAGVSDKGTSFKIKDMQRGTRVFKSVYHIYEKSSITTSHRDEHLATIALHPASSIMRANMCIIKVENRVLYQQYARARIFRMLEQLNLEYCGITRADICVDLHEFVNGLHPLALLRGYRKNEYIKRGSRRYSQWLTAPYSASTIDGQFSHDIKSEEHVTHCVSWGGAQSDVHVKMYNKTKEIKEESDKQYIAQWHRLNGLDKSRDVWRVEISIQRRSRYLYNQQDDVIMPVDLHMLLDKEFLREIFMGLSHRHFSFKVAELGKSARSFKELSLFALDDLKIYSPAAVDSKPIAGRTCKVAANFIEKVCRTTDFMPLVKHIPYCKESMEVAHSILGELYEGLRVLGVDDTEKPMPSRERLREQFEWLRQWGLHPSDIDGVPEYDLDYLYSRAEARQLYMETLALERARYEVYIANHAADGL